MWPSRLGSQTQSQELSLSTAECGAESKNRHHIKQLNVKRSWHPGVCEGPGQRPLQTPPRLSGRPLEAASPLGLMAFISSINQRQKTRLTASTQQHLQPGCWASADTRGRGSPHARGRGHYQAERSTTLDTLHNLDSCPPLRLLGMWRTRKKLNPPHNDSNSSHTDSTGARQRPPQ